MATNVVLSSLMLHNAAGTAVQKSALTNALKGITFKPLTFRPLLSTGGIRMNKINGAVEIRYDYVVKKADLKVIESTVNNSAVAGGMYGAETDATFGYIKPTTTGTRHITIGIDSHKYWKEIIAKDDSGWMSGFEGLIAKRLQAWTASCDLEIENKFWSLFNKINDEANLSTTLYTAAEIAEIKLQTTNDTAGKRVKTIDPTSFNLEAFRLDLAQTLRHISLIGKKVEKLYPFGYGNVLDQFKIVMNPAFCDMVVKAFKAENLKDAQIALLGWVLSEDARMIKSINGVEVMVMDELEYEANVDTTTAANNGKFVAMRIVPTGEHGAISLPIIRGKKANVRPNYAGIASEADIIEGVSVLFGGGLLNTALAFSWLFASAPTTLRIANLEDTDDGEKAVAEVEKEQANANTARVAQLAAENKAKAEAAEKEAAAKVKEAKKNKKNKK